MLYIGALHAKKFNGRGPKLMIFKLLNPTTALAIGTISDYMKYLNMLEFQ